MDFQLSDEQKLLADSLEGWLRKQYAFEDWRKLVRSELGYSQANWQTFAEMGWLGVALPEDHGGLGGGPVETMVIAERFGAALVAEPYFSSIVLGGGLVAIAGDQAQQAEILPKLAEGRIKLAFAFAEHGSRFALNEVATKATKTGAGYAISGKKIVVWDAPGADLLIVLARTAGGSGDENGLGLFLVDNKAAGVTRRDYRTVDARRAADISFENASAIALGDAEAAFPHVMAVVDKAIAYLAAEAVGAMQVLHETTLAYVKTRKQFGRAIGDFQVIQHRMVDMMIHLESARSLALLATLKADAPAPERAKAAAAAKVQIGKSGRWVGQQAVQLHGGMGMTDELNVGHYMKRLMMIDTAFGHADYHQRRFAALANAEAA
ncbi:acyl-CoA dehydrogenase family protein [Ferrovibrio sp.]|uniref:acyl-CoA dehydrogenase family protein n=1 Tax=Ferrovibrio sp. TaxID=1917215 RepID=UPI0025C6F124|nr:acyl-CoA dehydrogenase family protein [Ferrovibrio sp.]MBX3454733.1 acyl-CoA dehydrogenase family protein [Ferrovibrio sp.]